jgi:hypothetical protein
MKVAVMDIAKLFPPLILDGHSWAHQRSAADRKRHKVKTAWVGDRGRQYAAARRMGKPA